jgi:DNA-binding MarR family transcriptional regulator
VQFAALQTVANQPGLDQRTLAASIGFDTSTIAGVVDRLEARGLLLRQVAPQDKRVRLLTLTREGSALLAAAVPGMLRAQERMLAPLLKAERAEFMRMLRVLVTANNEHSRAPSEGAA